MSMRTSGPGRMRRASQRQDVTRRGTVPSLRCTVVSVLRLFARSLIRSFQYATPSRDPAEPQQPQRSAARSQWADANFGGQLPGHAAATAVAATATAMV